jgi:antitoxin (DNA-binding transcriptional repressor) of toxin-antitoxin stability system
VPIAKLTAVKRQRERVFGADRGRIEMTQDFDATLRDHFLENFEL